ncbi:hypothetical protein A3C32_02195 [Candidatus Daviesbacteria bacterium RIFCSPHIGHO2_02_FULL_41_14]|uniref:BioF2-like acetyltransferase domain-containing protein n=1 Tax=Candidatus Daviesbacteria bacterium RIFCSPLOWO2_01_FULL_40_24 TaxID=1797787 RepID=A0A1F5MK58_9BACT|nr:MAG: hypothetical protein A2780_02145 [Candidatus Daviesbacteria bacterium RIFCSPHIGHO2_01_FULL_41_45]OGE34381.1 MAG: hypothetical protein A3C32_02195 [Candidatus Daviesbacteria bacterium RIFCSPHIGHO2_02_FULL_41_14]OGE65699.1 MAG: hypothetical protein A3B49_03995 [Candidatus Daviesbacteria bacterium RIFCSPLOWO2_01_FULL_40_24]
MDLRLLSDPDKDNYNKLITHVVQSWEWGSFRETLGLTTLRYGLFIDKKLHLAFQLTIHKIPFTNKTFGYLPKGPYPSKELLDALVEIGKKYNCIAIKIEPNIQVSDSRSQANALDKRLIPSSKTLFTKYNFLLDLTQSDDQILQKMHPKIRYNIKVAQKHQVVIEERTDDDGLAIYLKLYFETTKRQNYHGHSPTYHRLLWNTLKQQNMARILIASYTTPGSNVKIPLSAWMLFNFKDTLYYPYGGSSSEYKNVMASTLLAWETIKLGKKLKLKTLDLWGALEPEASINHPWRGFHQFKERLGPSLVENLGSFDLVFNKPMFFAFNQIDKMTKLKVLLLRTIAH